MHELSICGSVADIATKHAGGRPVDVVHLRIGQLRQIVPDTLVYCWSMVTTSTELDGSRLEIEYVRARISCRTCGQVTEFDDFPVLLCTACDGADVEVHGQSVDPRADGAEAARRPPDYWCLRTCPSPVTRPTVPT